MPARFFLPTYLFAGVQGCRSSICACASNLDRVVGLAIWRLMRSKVMGRASLTCLVWQITLPLSAYPKLVQQVFIHFVNVIGDCQNSAKYIENVFC
jgi:hypothetical protein